MNPLTVLLAVSAWERFVADVRALATREWIAPGAHKARNGEAYLGLDRKKPEFPGQALTVLSDVSGARLPAVWRIRTFQSWKGKVPHAPTELVGSDIAVMASEVDAWVRLRNSVAHRCMPQDRDRESYFESDAKSHTIQSGWARTVLAVFLQLTDQAILAIAAEARFTDSNRLRLPHEWFADGELSELRGVGRPGALWGGHELFRPSSL